MTGQIIYGSSLRELAHRESAGIEVTLYWDEQRDRVTVTVLDTRTDVYFELEAPRDKALDAFHHPYHYATNMRVLSTDALLAA